MRVLKSLERLNLGTRNRGLKLKIIGMTNAKDILFNFSSKFFLFAFNLFFLPFALITAYDLSGRLPFLGMLVALCAVSTLWLTQGVEPFASSIWSYVDDFTKLDESALRILSFFRSKKAKELILRVSLVYFLIVILTWFLSNTFVHRFSFTRHMNLPDARFELIGAATFFFGICVYGTLTVIVFGYALKHFDEVQNSYEPWPIDKPYYLSFSFGKKKKKGGGEAVSAKSTKTEEKGSEEQNFPFSHAVYYGLVIFAVVLLFTNARFILDIFTGSFGKSSYEKLAYFLLGLVLLKGADFLVKKK